MLIQQSLTVLLCKILLQLPSLQQHQLRSLLLQLLCPLKQAAPKDHKAGQVAGCRLPCCCCRRRS
jgi:hypothetical protein